MKKHFDSIVLSWGFQITWAVICLMILIWNILTGSPIGTLVALAALAAMMFAMHKHWEAQVTLRNRDRETTRQWTEDDL